MGSMIPVHLIGGKQFMKARVLHLPVVFDGGFFRMPSSTGGEGEHEVRFDSHEEPLMYSCSCRAGRTGTPCWAAARALDVLSLLSVNNVYVGRGPQGAPAAKPDVSAKPAPPLKAFVTEGGEMALMRSETPPAGTVINVR